MPLALSALDDALRARLRADFLLDAQGIHGLPHWERVRENGLALARHTGADPDVVELFAWLHDSRRRHDGGDPAHGHRAAEAVRELVAEGLIRLDPARLELLLEACRLHSHGVLEADVTVQTCWDADRLDLGRVGITPSPERLCTEPARRPETIRWAYARSLGRDPGPCPL